MKHAVRRRRMHPVALAVVPDRDRRCRSLASRPRAPHGAKARPIHEPARRKARVQHAHVDRDLMEHFGFDVQHEWQLPTTPPDDAAAADATPSLRWRRYRHLSRAEHKRMLRMRDSFGEESAPP